MFKSKKLAIIVAVLMVAPMILAACGPTPEPQIIEKIVTEVVEKVVTEIVEVAGTPEVKEVIVTEVVEVPVTVAAEEKPAGPKVGGAGDIYRMAFLSDMTTLNIWAAYDPDASFWNYAVYGSFWPGLFTYSDQRFDWVPSLASDFPTDLVEEDGMWVSEVPIRQGALWSDGTEITANDFAWTANTVVAFNLSGNWEAYDDNFLDHVEAVDAYNAKIFYHTKPGLSRHQFGVMFGPILSQAYWEPKVADLMAQMADLSDMDPESEEYLAAREEIIQALYLLDSTDEPVAGPYLLTQWEQGAFIELTANPNYSWKGEVRTNYANGAFKSVLGGEEFVAYGDASGDVSLEVTEGPWFNTVLFSLYNADAATLALEAGEVDFVLTPNGLSKGQVDQLSDNPEISIATNPANGFRYMAFNFLRPPLDDVAVRQAINCMIDKGFLTNNLLQGQAIAVYTPVPKGNAFWYNPDVTIFCDGMTEQERMTESVRILTEAGYTWDVEPAWNEDRGGSIDAGQGLKLPDGTYFPDMTLLAPSAGYDPLRATAGVYVEQWIKSIGIPVDAELTNFNNILTAIYDTGDFDMFILGWGLSLYPDYVCDFFYTGSGFNSGSYSNPDFDAACDVFYAETDIDAAREQNFALQNVLATDLPYIYLFTTPMYDAFNNETIIFPYTEVLDGIGPGYYGLKSVAQAVQ